MTTRTEQLEKLQDLLDVIHWGERRLQISVEHYEYIKKFLGLAWADKYLHNIEITQKAIVRLKERFNRYVIRLELFTFEPETNEEEEEEFSTCCGAEIIYGDICTQCKEHV